MEVGHELRQARERRAMSLQQLSSITKISPHVLQALEASDGGRLPARVFTRAFVRSYAIEVGLDPDDTVHRYFAQFETHPPIPVENEHSPAVALDASAPSSAFSDDDAPQRAPARVLQGRFGTAAVLTLVGLTILTLAARNGSDADDRTGTPQPSTATAGPIPAPASSPQAVGTSGSTPAPASALRIEIVPTGPCWVLAATPEARLFGAMLNAGDRRVIDAVQEVMLRVGDPATFAFTINGRPARIAGVPAQAVTVHVTRGNYTQFLSR